MTGKTLPEMLEASARDHDHLCPRQILGARLGQAGLGALGFEQPPPGKRLLIIAETDGCFLDGLSAATGCTPGHRTLRIEDYGKTAAVFVDTLNRRTLRIAPRLDLRARADAYAPDEPRRYFAQMRAYRGMPLEELFTTESVRLCTSIEAIVSRPRVRVPCAVCGEEIMNERTVWRNGIEVCRACAHGGYYAALAALPIRLAEAQ
jgi:formylmethanofuran dehydrogenase subunit E